MPQTLADTINPRAALLQRMADAARAVGRDPATVGLTAVSKQQPWTAIESVLQAGQLCFGENRVQEAMTRWDERRSGLELRLIGPLQTNKARDAVAFFDVIETLDRPRLAERIVVETQVAGRAPRLLVQVNIGEEPQKSGVAPREADAFIDHCRETLGLSLEGLMCVAPQDQPPGPYFALLAKIARRQGLTSLSMGMSADFEIAIRHGATAVRVGSALFGARGGHG